jgi:hypothetical protein
MSIRFALGLCVFVSLAACEAGRPGLDAIAERYVRAALKLSQHDPSLVEQWRGPEAWTPGPRRPVVELLEEVDALLEQSRRATSDASSSIDRARARYLDGQIRALRYALDRQLGRAATIDEQAREEFDTTFPPLDTAAVARVHARLNEVLPGAAPLAERVASLRRSTAVPRERRLAVLKAALDACRTAMPALLPLPHEDHIELRFRSGLRWDAFLRYEGNAASELAINDDGALDAARALRLACHEAYPGHHIQHLLIDRVYGERQWPELLLTPGFGPHLFYLEGAAEVGADLAIPPVQREQLYRDRLLPAAELPPNHAATLAQVEALLQDLVPVVTDVARKYLDGSITQEAAVERLRSEALVANAAGTLSFIEQRRARALVYGEGRRAVYALMPSRDLAGLHAAFKSAAALQ